MSNQAVSKRLETLQRQIADIAERIGKLSKQYGVEEEPKKRGKKDRAPKAKARAQRERSSGGNKAVGKVIKWRGVKVKVMEPGKGHFVAKLQAPLRINGKTLPKGRNVNISGPTVYAILKRAA